MVNATSDALAMRCPTALLWGASLHLFVTLLISINQVSINLSGLFINELFYFRCKNDAYYPWLPDAYLYSPECEITDCKDYRLIISSNAPREFLEIEIEKIERYFHHIFSAPSDFKQIKKTDFYRSICDILKIEPAEMVHVGDHRVYDFIVPGEIGIFSFYLDRKGEKHDELIVKNLKEFKVKIEKIEKTVSYD
jgi:FMN phosphatase YigB (HAD superfamily)